jgi:hypothetical protein
MIVAPTRALSDRMNAATTSRALSSASSIDPCDAEACALEVGEQRARFRDGVAGALRGDRGIVDVEGRAWLGVRPRRMRRRPRVEQLMRRANEGLRGCRGLRDTVR